MDQLKEGQRQRAGSGRRCRAGRRGSKGVKEMGGLQAAALEGLGKGVAEAAGEVSPRLTPTPGLEAWSGVKA